MKMNIIMSEIEQYSYKLDKYLIQIKLEPVFSSNNCLLGYEVLSCIKNKYNESHPVDTEGFFNSLSEEILNDIFHHQVEFTTRNCDFFYKNSLFLSLNAPETVLKNYPWLDIKKEAIMIDKVLRLEVNEKVIPCRNNISILEKISEIIPIWLDDFSLSMFSFDYIVNGHFDCIKVDKELYWKLRSSSSGINYLSSFCNLLVANNKKIIIEGIETITDQQNLKRCGATGGQGWLWASQVPHEIINLGVNNSSQINPVVPEFHLV